VLRASLKSMQGLHFTHESWCLGKGNSEHTVNQAETHARLVDIVIT